jgi:hypothetical protein
LAKLPTPPTALPTDRLPPPADCQATSGGASGPGTTTPLTMIRRFAPASNGFISTGEAENSDDRSLAETCSGRLMISPMLPATFCTFMYSWT